VSDTRVPGYLPGTRVTGIETGTRVPGYPFRALVTAKPIDIPFGVWNRRDLMTHVLGGVRILPRKGALLDSNTWTSPRLISSTSFAFKLAESVIFNSQNVLPRLLQTASVSFCTGT